MKLVFLNLFFITVIEIHKTSYDKIKKNTDEGELSQTTLFYYFSVSMKHKNKVHTAIFWYNFTCNATAKEDARGNASYIPQYTATSKYGFFNLSHSQVRVQDCFQEGRA